MCRRSRFFWIPLALLSASTAFGSDVDSPSFRVDVIVFSHLSGETDQRFRAEAVDFTDIFDLRTHARAASWSPPQVVRSAEEQSRLDALATLDQLRVLDRSAPSPAGVFTGGPTHPIHWQGLPDLSIDMMRVWEQLADSARHQPLTWRSWHQALDRDERSRWVRLADQRILELDWLQLESVDAAYLPEQPPYEFLLPAAKRSLDGRIRVRQRQFVHVDLELFWQEPVAARPVPLSDEFFRPQGFRFHPLTQSRSIRAGRIEYFDSSKLGVLVRIEEMVRAADAEDAPGQTP